MAMIASAVVAVLFAHIHFDWIAPSLSCWETRKLTARWMARSVLSSGVAEMPNRRAGTRSSVSVFMSSPDDHPARLSTTLRFGHLQSALGREDREGPGGPHSEDASSATFCPRGPMPGIRRYRNGGGMEGTSWRSRFP